MPTSDIRLTGLLPATPQRVYDAWLSAKGHTAMTGSRATMESTEIGARFTAWNGYIEGTHVALEPGRRILQSWRANDFPPDAPESYLEVTLAPAPGGTRITLRHWDLPAKQAAGFLKGWKDFYLKPMAKYFGETAKRAPGGKGSATKEAKKKAAKEKPGPKRPSRRAGATRKGGGRARRRP